MPIYSPEEKIELLTDAGLLTERQAEAYVYRVIEGESGIKTAELMGGLDSTTVSDYKTVAENKVAEAQATVDVLAEIGTDDIELKEKQ